MRHDHGCFSAFFSLAPTLLACNYHVVINVVERSHIALLVMMDIDIANFI